MDKSDNLDMNGMQVYSIHTGLTDGLRLKNEIGPAYFQ